MSVRLSERGEGKLEVLNSAKILAEYTISQCKSEKVFPKSQRRLANIKRGNTWHIQKEMVNWYEQQLRCNN